MATSRPATARTAGIHVAAPPNRSAGVASALNLDGSSALAPGSAPGSALKPRSARGDVGGSSSGVAAAMGATGGASTGTHVPTRTPARTLPRPTTATGGRDVETAARVTASTPGLLSWREATGSYNANTAVDTAAGVVAAVDRAALSAGGVKPIRRFKKSRPSLDDMSVVSISRAFADRASGLAGTSALNSSAFATTLQQHTVGGGLARAGGASGARYTITAAGAADRDSAPVPPRDSTAAAAAAAAAAREGFSVADIGEGRGYGHGGLARAKTDAASSYQIDGYARTGSAAAMAATAALSLSAVATAAAADGASAYATTAGDLGRPRTAAEAASDPAVAAAQEGTWMGVQPSTMRALWGALDTSHLGNHARHHRLLAAWAAQRSRMELQLGAFASVAADMAAAGAGSDAAGFTSTRAAVASSSALAAATLGAHTHVHASNGSAAETAASAPGAGKSSVLTAPSVPYDILVPHAPAVAPPSAASAASFAVSAQRDPVTGSKKGLYALGSFGTSGADLFASTAAIHHSSYGAGMSGAGTTLRPETMSLAGAGANSQDTDPASHHSKLSARLGSTSVADFTAAFLRAGGAAGMQERRARAATASRIQFADGVDPATLTITHLPSAAAATSPRGRAAPDSERAPQSALITAALRSRNAAVLDADTCDRTLTTPATLAASAAASALTPGARAAAAAAPAAGVARADAAAAEAASGDPYHAPFGTGVNAELPQSWAAKASAALAVLKQQQARTAAAHPNAGLVAGSHEEVTVGAAAAAAGRQNSRVIQQLLAAAARDPITGAEGRLRTSAAGTANSNSNDAGSTNSTAADGTDAAALLLRAASNAGRAGQGSRPYEKLVQRIWGTAAVDAPKPDTAATAAAAAAALVTPYAVGAGSAPGAATTPARTRTTSASSAAAQQSNAVLGGSRNGNAGGAFSPSVRTAAQTYLRDALAREDTAAVYAAPARDPGSAGATAALRAHGMAAPATPTALRGGEAIVARGSAKKVFANAFGVDAGASAPDAMSVTVPARTGAYTPLFKPVSAWRVQDGAVVNVAHE
jgi:hypothetical protein